MTDKHVVQSDYDTRAEEVEPRDIVLGRMVGSGRTAEVFLGLWRGRAVAIKQLCCLRMSASEKLAFNREVSILANVNHPNLVRLFGYCMSSVPCHVVCEYCEGGTLFDVLHNRIDLDISLAQQVKMSTDIARGMDYLHKFSPQIIHRDLKSLNLLLAKTLKGLRDVPVVKVTDFGLARVLEPKDKVALTAFVGTVHWMAPEMFASKSYNEKIDVYSYAIVLFEIFAREPPWKDNDSEDIERLVRRGARPDPEAIPPDLPEVLLRIIQASWAPRPEDRPSFDVILQELSAIECRSGGGGGGNSGPRKWRPDAYASSGYMSKTRAMGEADQRAVSL